MCRDVPCRAARQAGSLSLPEILRIGMQTADGLAAAHAQGLVHRDVKPANILLEEDVERVRLTDFGLARAAAEAAVTRSGVVAGTPHYMAPEQALGLAADQRADLFSLGSTIYAMCAGHPPFRADSPLAVLKRVCDDEPRPLLEVNAEIPAWLQAIVGRLMQKDPARRIQTASEVSDLLRGCLAHVQQPSVTPLPAEVLLLAEQSGPRKGQRKARLVGLAALVIGASSLMLWNPGIGHQTQQNDQENSASDPINPSFAWGSDSKDVIERQIQFVQQEASALEARLFRAEPTGQDPLSSTIEQLKARAKALEQEMAPSPHANGRFPN